MKMVYRDRNLTYCDIVRGILEDSGIDVMLKNEYACNTAGASIVGMLDFAWPEVWVIDEDAQAAVECIKNAGLSFLNE